jgi:PIN domain nuclease of toxin-antitoxin system
VKILLDTCTFLWLITDDARLSQSARREFLDEENEPYLSSVSVWEIMVRIGIGKLSLPSSSPRYVADKRKEHGISALVLDEESILTLPLLPLLHKDPFDRALVCQAIAHGMTIFTPDPQIRQYAVLSDW